MTNHPNRKQTYVIRLADNTVRGPFTTRAAANMALAEWTGPRSAVRAVFEGATIERFARMSDSDAQQFGGSLNSSRIR